MKKYIILVAFLLVSQLNFAQQDEELKKDALKVIELNGSKIQTQVLKEQFLSRVPKGKKAEFIKEFEGSLPEMYENQAKNYMRLYTKEDLKAMIAFYESPVGKKIQANAGEMSLRAQANGKEWIMKMQNLVNKYQFPD